MHYTEMRKINNLADLKAEKSLLNMRLSVVEANLKVDIEWMKEEFRPIRTVGKLFSHAMINKSDGILNEGIRFTIDAVLKNLILSKTGWVTKLIVPFLVKNLSTNYILEKRPEIFGILRNLIRKARKTTSHHNHYDSSTVDEMDF